MLSLFGTMEKRRLLKLLLIISVIGGSHQRPQPADDVLASTTMAATETVTTTTTVPGEETTKESTKTTAAAATASAIEKLLQVTEATTAVSIRTIVNVTSSSSSSPHHVAGEVFEDFEPSRYYYGPGGEPKFERPSQQEVVREVFRQPEYFWRPDDRTYRNVSKPNGTRDVVVFPPLASTATNQRHKHFERQQLDGQTDESSHRSPHVWSAEVSLRSKPVKHDSGDILPPNFGSTFHGAGDFYERPTRFGVVDQHPGHDTPPYLHRPVGVVRAPPKSYHGIAATHHHKKKDPWRSMLSMLATILPVGLLLASFPPTVIKVNSTQYPYQFQKNSTTYYPNVVIGRYKMLENNNGKRKINKQNELSGYLDDCLKKKICENIKNNYLSSEFNSLLKNHKLNYNRDDSIVEISKAAMSTASESCRVFVCSN